ncbi:hypothetical protein ACEPAH_7119 [Sanghuangporus vaninii]
MPSKKDYRKGKSPSDMKPWKMRTSKGYGTASGRECLPGRNYGYRWEIRPRFLSGGEETETETETEHVDQEHTEDEDFDRHTINESSYEDESESEEDSYELQLAKALSLSLEMTETDCNAFDFNSLDDTDGYSLMETGSEDHDSSDEAEWIDVDGFGTTRLERPTYAQMTKVEVT